MDQDFGRGPFDATGIDYVATPKSKTYQYERPKTTWKLQLITSLVYKGSGFPIKRRDNSKKKNNAVASVDLTSAVAVRHHEIASWLRNMAALHDENSTALLSKVNQRLQEATSRGDYKEVQRLARIAEELRLLEEKEREIAQGRANLSKMLESPPKTQVDADGVSARERGNRVRHVYVEGTLSKHIQLAQIDSKKYRTLDGGLVGITYAKELEMRPRFWFLGLSDEDFDWVILLCESSDDSGSEIAALVLPSALVKKIWKVLSRSKGQVKFHVARTGYTNFELHLPGSESINISQYLNAEHQLKQVDRGNSRE